MPLSAVNIAEAAIAGTTANAVYYTAEDSLKQIPPDLTLAALEKILESLTRIEKFLKTPDEHVDLFYPVQIYKAGFGSPYIPRGDGREYKRVLVGVTTPLFIQTTVIGSFTFTVNPGIWTSLDFPDDSIIQLDATATPNQQNIFMRFTNRPPSN